MNEQCYSAVAERLLSNGWSPLPFDGKRPCEGVRWREYQQRQPSHLEVLAWEHAYPKANVGGVMGPVAGVVGLDIDADEPPEAMQLNDIADEVFGPSPVVRVGRYPRTLRLYQPARIGKQKRVGAVEILGHGRVAVLFGLHPVTQEPYRHVGASSPLDLRPRDLPTITRGQLERFRLEVEGVATSRASSPVRQQGCSVRMGATGMTSAEAMHGVSEGRRHMAMFSIASACRGSGRAELEAIECVSAAAGRCCPPLPAAEAIEVVRWCYAHFPSGPPKPVIALRNDVPKVLCVAYLHALESPYPHKAARYGLFVAMARDLQQWRGEKPIALPQPALAKILECSQRNVSKLVRRAIDDELLILADPSFQPRVTAKRYHFVGCLHV